VFERYGRYEPEVAEALTDMFGSFTSTHRVGKVAEKPLGVAPSASAVSRLNQALTEQYEAWRVRRLLPHYRIIYAGRWSIFPFGMGPKAMRRWF
jgi:putative transposase